MIRPVEYLIGIVVWACLQFTFVAVYATRPWHSTAVGRALMTKSSVISVWLVAILVHYFVIELPWGVWTVLAWSMAAAVGWQLGVLIHLIRTGPTPPAPPPRA